MTDRTFNGQYTRGFIRPIRIGLVPRWEARNNRNQTSPHLGSIADARRWLEQQDKPAKPEQVTP